MAMVFPTSPIVGQVFTSGGRSWVWNGSTWDSPRSDNPPLAIPTGNVIINGGFDIWQRGTSFVGTGIYTADRWATFNTAGTTTHSREASVVPPGQTYSMKLTQTVATTTPYIFQAIETANTIPLVGQVVTVSAYVYGTVSSSFSLELVHSTTVDRTPVTAWDGTVAIVTQAVGPTWTRITATGTVPSNAKSLRIGVYVNGLALSQPAYIAGVQLEAGAVATPFRRNAPSIQAEFAACQRYYQLFQLGATAPSGHFLVGTKWSATDALVANLKMSVPMRVTPTATLQNSVVRVVFSSGVGSLTFSTAYFYGQEIALIFTNNTLAPGYGWVDSLGDFRLNAEL